MEFTTELRSTGGTTTGFVVEVDTAPRSVDVPDDLAAALAADPAAAAAWERLSHSRRRQHAEAIAAAKKPETRQRRIASTISALTG